MKQTLITFACLIAGTFTAVSQGYLDKRIQQLRTNTPAGSMDTCVSQNKKKVYLFWENLILGGAESLADYNVTISFWNAAHPTPRSYADKFYFGEPLLLIDPVRAGIWPEKEKQEYEFQINCLVYKTDSMNSVKTLIQNEREKVTIPFKFKAFF